MAISALNSVAVKETEVQQEGHKKTQKNKMKSLYSIKESNKAEMKSLASIIESKKTKPKTILAYRLMENMGKDEFGKSLNEVNEDNVIKTLENYEILAKSVNNSKVKTLTDAIFNEFFISTKNQKKYVNYIQGLLASKCEKLGVDNTEINKAWQNELDEVTSGVLPHLGFIDTKNLNFFTKEYITRIKIRERLLKDNEEKYKQVGGNTKPNPKELSELNEIIKTYNVDTKDTLGDGKINNEIRQTNGTCWAAAAINAMAAKPEIREKLNSFLLKKDGITSVYLGKPDKIYSFTEDEIMADTYKAIGTVGDGDVNAILMAAQKYIEENPEEGGEQKNVRGGNKVEKMYEIITGLKPVVKSRNMDFEDYPPNTLIKDDGISIKSTNELKKILQQKNNYAYSIGFSGAAVNNEKRNKANVVKDGKITNEKIKLYGAHSYAVTSGDDKNMYLKDSNYPNMQLVLPKEYIFYTDSYALYKYR